MIGFGKGYIYLYFCHFLWKSYLLNTIDPLRIPLFQKIRNRRPVSMTTVTINVRTYFWSLKVRRKYLALIDDLRQSWQQATFFQSGLAGHQASGLVSTSMDAITLSFRKGNNVRFSLSNIITLYYRLKRSIFVLYFIESWKCNLMSG